MFTKLAKFRQFELRRIAPGPGVAAYSNDNLPGFRRPAEAPASKPGAGLSLVPNRRPAGMPMAI
jgi:hypothetical protein